jgi:hypothetical protein
MRPLSRLEKTSVFARGVNAGKRTEARTALAVSNWHMILQWLARHVSVIQNLSMVFTNKTSSSMASAVQTFKVMLKWPEQSHEHMR